jgi:hypothetical protein
MAGIFEFITDEFRQAAVLARFPQASDSKLGRARLGRPSLRCWLFGHDDVIRRDAGRMYVECCDCGRASAGITIGPDRVRRVPRATPVTAGRPDLAAAASTSR